MREAPKVLHLLWGDRVLVAAIKAMIFGLSRALTPAARARELSPLGSLWQARCRATRDDEQAVSTTMHGPCSPNQYDTRPAAVELKAAT